MSIERTLICLLIIFISSIQLIELENDFRDFVEHVASIYHSQWKQNYLQQHPHTKHRFKLTTSRTNYHSSDFVYPMILPVGSCLVHRNLKVAQSRSNHSLIYVDILNMNFKELPDDWAHENRATATVACRLILRNVRQNRLFNRKLIDNMSKRIHFHWMKRNVNRTMKHLMVPYHQLAELEKEKDRRAVFVACQLFNQIHFYQRFQTKPIHIIE